MCWGNVLQQTPGADLRAVHLLHFFRGETDRWSVSLIALILFGISLMHTSYITSVVQHGTLNFCVKALIFAVITQIILMAVPPWKYPPRIPVELARLNAKRYWCAANSYISILQQLRNFYKIDTSMSRFLPGRLGRYPNRHHNIRYLPSPFYLVALG